MEGTKDHKTLSYPWSAVSGWKYREYTHAMRKRWVTDLDRSLNQDQGSLSPPLVSCVGGI